MTSQNLCKITDEIYYLPAIENPLSADVVIIKPEEENLTWIYDTGASEQACNLINSIEGEKNIVISHFHPDHCANLNKVSYSGLFVSKNTFGYTHAGTIIEDSISFDYKKSLVQILNIPSSHAKGSLFLKYKNYLFTGDGLYCTEKKGKKVFNAGILLEEIRILEKVDTQYFCLSHRSGFVFKKEIPLNQLKKIYSQRINNQPFIEI